MCFLNEIRYVDKTRGLATILGAKEEDLRQQMRLAGISLAGEFAGPGEPGDPTGVMFLRQVHGKNVKCVKVTIYKICFIA